MAIAHTEYIYIYIYISQMRTIITCSHQQVHGRDPWCQLIWKDR